MVFARCKALLDGDTETVISGSCCAPVQRVAGGWVAAANYKCEAAGAAFTARFEARASSEEDDSSSSDDEASPGENYGKSDSKDKKSGGGYLKISELLKGVQLYELMGISEGASQDEIKKAYRSLALSAHPDKQATMDPEEAKKVEENFIKIKEAYDLLLDPVKRKQYDSSLDFDESLPKFRQGDDFFEVFGEAFRRNARFSVKRPVPDLGTAEDEPRSWKRFYDFWNGFQSWRDPVMLAQQAGEEICDLAEAECREERRWMVRENEKVARKYKQQERDRIAKLVSLAESADPRVQAEKEAKKQARAAEAARREEERTAVKRAKEEAELKQRIAEEIARKEEEERRKAEKAARDTIKERVKKCRQRLRGFHQAVKEHVVLEQVNEVCLQLKEEDLRSLGDRIDQALKGKKGQDPLAAAEVFHEAIKSIGLVPMKVAEDAVSTTSGPTDSQEDSQAAEERQQREEQKRQRAAENEAKKKLELERQAEERAKAAAEKAEERKKKEEQRKKEQAAAEAAKRQQEKKEEQKARKAEEKQKKQEEQEKIRKEQQREESRLKAIEQSEKDKQMAQQKKQEMELERLVQMFSQDRVNRLTKLEALTDEKLSASLQEAIASDASLAGAFKLLSESDLEVDRAVDCGMALVHQLGVWNLGLPTPAQIRPENALRNRAKKGRKRLSDTMANFLKLCPWDVEMAEATEWQRGIVDGSVEIPCWSQELTADAPAETTEARGEKPESKKEKKGKNKSKEAEEDLDQILAELETPGSKKKAKKGKN